MYAQNGVRLLGNINVLHGAGDYSAGWGYTAPNGREYALTGAFSGTSIIDITDTLSMHEVAFIPGPSSDWHEMRTYKNYAYVVSEGGGGTQIIDLTNLPTSATLVTSFIYTSAGKSNSRAHSIEIFDGFMYLNGCATWSPGGILIFDLANPTAPAFVGQYATRYIHDCYVRNDTIFGAAINAGGVDIIDAHIKSNPQLITRITYSGAGTHNTWTTKDRRYLISTDEVGGTPKTLKFWDLSTLPVPPSSPAVTYTYSPVDIEHNVTVRGDYAYTAWYEGGFAVTNISNPVSPQTAGWYDTYPGPSSATDPYHGAWSIYPYFPSGKITVCDIETGTWVFRFNNLAPRRAVRLSLPVNIDTVHSVDSIRFRWTAAANLQQDPHYYMLSVLGSGVNTNTKVNDTTFLLTNLSAYQVGQTYQWTVRSKDEVNDIASQDTFRFVYGGIPIPPAAPTLSSPANGAVNQPTTLTFTWNAASGATSYRLQVSTDSLFSNFFFDDSIIAGTTWQVLLAHNTSYYWHVRAKNLGGVSAYSQGRSFSTVIAPPSIPTLVAPATGAVNQPLTVLLTWNAAATASTYRLQVSTDSAFTVTLVNDSTISDTVYQVGLLSNHIKYYWRVKASNIGGASAYTSTWNFTTIVAAPVTPVLFLPPNNAQNQSAAVALVWRSSAGATTYRLQVSIDSLFGTTAYEDSTISDTTQQMSSLAISTSYFWRTSASNIGGTSPWSLARRFTTTSDVARQFPVMIGWNMLSVPLTVSDARKTSVFPTATSGAFAYVPSLGYVEEDTLFNGNGYWLKFSASDSITIIGTQRHIDTVDVSPGWNLIGTLSDSVSIAGIQQIPSDIIVSDYYEFTGVYVASDVLRSAHSYWVKANQNGILILAPSTAGALRLKGTGESNEKGSLR